MSILGWVPPLFITFVTVFTYYAYVVAMCIFTSKFLIEKIILITIFHLLLLMTMWCFVRSVFTRPHKPSAKFAMEETEWSKVSYDYNWKKERAVMNNLRDTLGILTTTSDLGEGILQYCYHCHILKPDRCHHCSKCGVCVLKMDHHCPWVNNCVGFHNYKYFLLFLAYISFSVLFIISTSARFVFEFFFKLSHNTLDNGSVKGSDFVILVMTFIYLLIGLVLLPLLNLHRDLLTHNVTTLENSRPVGECGVKPNFKTFDMGLKANFLQVFGNKQLYWFVPIFSSQGDGMSFPMFKITKTPIV